MLGVEPELSTPVLGKRYQSACNQVVMSCTVMCSRAGLDKTTEANLQAWSLYPSAHRVLLSKLPNGPGCMDCRWCAAGQAWHQKPPKCSAPLVLQPWLGARCLSACSTHLSTLLTPTPSAQEACMVATTPNHPLCVVMTAWGWSRRSALSLPVVNFGGKSSIESIDQHGAFMRH